MEESASRGDVPAHWDSGNNGHNQGARGRGQSQRLASADGKPEHPCGQGAIGECYAVRNTLGGLGYKGRAGQHQQRVRGVADADFEANVQHGRPGVGHGVRAVAPEQTCGGRTQRRVRVGARQGA